MAATVNVGQPLADSAAVNPDQVGGCPLGQPCRCEQGAEVGGGVAGFGEVPSP